MNINWRQWSIPILICYSASLVLFIAALFIGWRGIAKWSYVSAMTDAMRAYDSHRYDKVGPALESARAWEKNSTPAALLYAAVKLEPEAIDQAADLYKDIMVADPLNGEAAVGMGIVELKRAERSASPAEAETHLKSAAGYFKKAADIDPQSFSAAIGNGYVSLVRGIKGNNPSGVYQNFQNIRPESSSAPSRESLIDFYMGASIAAFLQRRDFDNALANMRRASQCAPDRIDIVANVFNLEAMKFGNIEKTAAEIRRDEAMLKSRIQDALTIASKAGANQEILKEACRNYICSLAWAYGAVGDQKAAEDILLRTSSATFADDPIPSFVDGMFKLFLSEKPGLTVRETMTPKRSARFAFQKSLPLVDRKRSPELAICLLNNIAAILEYEACEERNGRPRDEAIRLLGEAVAIDPTDYVVNRNLAVLLLKAGKTEEAKKFLAAAIKAASASQSPYEEDKKLLEKYFEEK